MSRFGNQATGVVVSVADEKDHRFTLGWKRLGEGENFAPPKRRTPRTADDPTPTGPVRRPHVDPTPSAQIRAQRAADPFGR